MTWDVIGRLSTATTWIRDGTEDAIVEAGRATDCRGPGGALVEGFSTSRPDFGGMASPERLAHTSTLEPPAWAQGNDSTAPAGAFPEARTLRSDPEFKYVNLRRYFADLNESISRAIQFAVFEPNGEALWDNVRTAVSDFLFNEWQRGALQGARPEEAYFVKCDRSTMTQDDLDHGRLVILVGVATVRPGEFVILRFSATTASAST